MGHNSQAKAAKTSQFTSNVKKTPRLKLHIGLHPMTEDL